MTLPATASPALDHQSVGLAVDHLTVTIDGTTLVEDVSFRLEAGEWLGLIGPNGAGKSTVLRALAGITEHDGTVSLLSDTGISASLLSDAGISGSLLNDTGISTTRPGATDIAIVPQNPVLPLGMTVVEYVLLGRTAHARDRFGWLGGESKVDRQVTTRVLTQLDLTEFATRPVTQLSGGEAQRTVLARALAQEPAVLLLDEPTSALDIGHQQSVLELVDDLRRTTGLTVLAAMHDLTLAARFSDRLALITRGSLDTIDKPEQVLQDDLLSQAYGVKLTVARVDSGSSDSHSPSEDDSQDIVVLPATGTRHNR